MGGLQIYAYLSKEQRIKQGRRQWFAARRATVQTLHIQVHNLIFFPQRITLKL